MNKDQLLTLVYVHQIECEEFWLERADRLIMQVRGIMSPEFRRSTSGVKLREHIKRIEDQLEEGLITGEEACNGIFDESDQALKVDPDATASIVKEYCDGSTNHQWDGTNTCKVCGDTKGVEKLT